MRHIPERLNQEKLVTVGSNSCEWMLVCVLALAVPAVAAVHDVTVGPGGTFTFVPADIVIAPGDTVRWTWASSGHNVGFGLPGAADNMVFFSGAQALTPNVFEFVFDAAFLAANPQPGGLYAYHCHPHGTFGMVGLVTVQAAPVPTVSEWGIAVMALSLCVLGVVFRRRMILRTGE